jgi:hypothetical protein
VAGTKANSEAIFQNVPLNYLTSQARTVESSLNARLALMERNERLASEVFLTEPRINEMEILIDEHAIRMLRQPNLLETDIPLDRGDSEDKQRSRADGRPGRQFERARHLWPEWARSETPPEARAHDYGCSRHGFEMSWSSYLPKCGSGNASP